MNLFNFLFNFRFSSILTGISAYGFLGLTQAYALQNDEKNLADKNAIIKVLEERVPQLRHIEEVTLTPMQGLYEVRIGTDIFYTDAKADFLIQGELFDTQARRNITEDRIQNLTAIRFTELPFEDSFKLVLGDGSRQIAVFQDPNCGYCKRFEREVQRHLDNVTLHIFLYPILSPASFEKSRDIWCAKEQSTVWSDWMTKDVSPKTISECSTTDSLQRNREFGRKYKITGTPTLIFADGTRIPGAVQTKAIEEKLAQIAALK